jgi:glycosyltransferase involved in cell wall biosynthesis
VDVLVLTTSRRAAWAGVLRSSLHRHHPDATMIEVGCDGRPGPRVAGALRLVDVEPGDLRAVDLVLAFGAGRAGWAALPWLLERARSSGLLGGGPVLVLDDTMVLHGPVDALVDAAGGRGAAARAAHRDATTGLGWGGCLPGALALGSLDAELLDWWRARLHDLIDPTVDDPLAQLWSELPVGTAVAAVPSPSLRCSSATVGELDLQLDGEQVLVDGEPLVLADLDGLDPERPWWFAPADGEPRRHVSESPALRHLLHDAADQLRAAGWGPGGDRETAVPGIAETPQLRRWYRSLLSADTEAPPNPYVTGEVGAYLDLLSAPSTDGATAVSVHADLLLEARPDLRAAFPAARWSDRDHLARWMWRHGLGEGESAVALLPDLPRSRPRNVVVDEQRPFGVNLVGYLTGELGLGVAARRMRIALEAAGVPVASVSYDRTSSRRSSDGTRSMDAPYHFNLIVITPDQLPYFVEDVGAEFLAGHHNIGLWYWETDVLTPRQLSSFAWVDEVWGATTYLCDVFASAERVPVTHVPVPLVFDDPHATAEDRARLGLDDRFTVLFSFDFLSVVERKNPLGLIEAYRRAFGPDDGARLILKGINGDVFPDKREELFDAAADRPDIEVWNRYLSSRDRLALVQSVDCYASLHRSEGLGLTMAEAMALGTPVVATAYSGNLDFMDEDSALLVPAEEILIGPGHLYPADGHWADPDLDVAAAHLRALKDDPELARRLVAAGKEAVGRDDVERVGDVAARRLRELGQGS